MTDLIVLGAFCVLTFSPRCTLLRSFLLVDSSGQLIFWSKKNNFLAFFKWIALQRRKNSLYLPHGALKLLIKSLFMEKTPFYRTKAFWTFVASIIAALAAYFTVSCSYTQKVFRHGVHQDTVKIESTIKSRNLSCLTKNLGTPSRSLSSSTLELSLWKRSSPLAPTTSSTVASSPFGLPSQTVFESKPQLIPLSLPTCHFISPLNKNCSTLSGTESFTSSRSQTFSFSSMLASPVLSVLFGRSRRGGRRKGKPRPKVKNIIIGGRHL